MPQVSILVVTYNGGRAVARLLKSLRMTTGVRYELVVVDNASRLQTRALLFVAALRRRIRALVFLDHNTLFGPGVNVAHQIADSRSSYLLLLNPDVVIKSPDWLSKMLAVHKRGATALGFVEGAPWSRADGYCLLVDRDLFSGLSDDYHWFWGVTRLQADLLQAGHAVQAVRSHDDLIVHSGGASGPPPLGARGMDTDPAEVVGWFGGRNVEVLEQL
jgi:glycosyltransferase involved in cell wall biosynthesis